MTVTQCPIWLGICMPGSQMTPLDGLGVKSRILKILAEGGGHKDLTVAVPRGPKWAFWGVLGPKSDSNAGLSAQECAQAFCALSENFENPRFDP